MKPTLENMEELLNAACNSGGSGYGISYYKQANACGMRAYLNDWNKAANEVGAWEASACDPDRPNTLRVGSAYHKLQEWWSENLLDDLRGFLAIEFVDPSFNLAMRYFEAYMQAFSKHYWGETLRNEWLLPESVAGHFKNHAWFSGGLLQRTPLQAKPDRVVRMREDVVAHVERERNLRLDGPGVYVIDFKTSGVDHDERYWQASPQALWYPHAVQLDQPDWTVRGLIFDIIRKPRKKSESVFFEAFYVPIYENARAMLRPFVHRGAVAVQNAMLQQEGNLTECVKSNFGRDEVCPYYQAQCAFTRRSA